MEYLWAFLIFIGIVSLTTILTGIFKFLIPLLFLALGYILGVESLILGIGGLLGSILNIIITNKYIRTQGAWSSAPVYGIMTSYYFIFSFIVTITTKYIFKLEFNLDYWFLFITAFIIWGVSIIIKIRKEHSLDNYLERVVKYRIVAKYDNDPKWATYLFFKNGDECWNETIYGSYRAKDPVNDLTFVYETREKALRYAKNTFINAVYYEPENIELNILEKALNDAELKLASEYFKIFKSFIEEKSVDDPKWFSRIVNNSDFDKETFIYNELISFVYSEIKTGNHHIESGKLTSEGTELAHLYYCSVDYLFQINKISEVKSDNHKIAFMKIVRAHYEM